MGSREILIDELNKTLGLSFSICQNICDKIKNELELVRIIHILRSKRIVNNLISPKAYGIKWIYDFFILEGVVFYEKGKQSEKISRLFQENLSADEKIDLLTNFLFSKPFKLGEKHSPIRHLMFKDFKNDIEFRKKSYYEDKEPNSCGRSCYCDRWIRDNSEKINNYISALTDKFIEIRNAIVHESFPVIILPDYENKKTAASFQSSVIDAYPIIGKKKFRAYECYMDPDIYFKITNNCISNFIRKKYLEK